MEKRKAPSCSFCEQKHEIPMSAVPCLAYRKALAEEQQDEMKEEKERPDPKIQTAEECIQSQSLTPTQLNEYCQKLFKFKELKIMRFKSWAERRKFSKSQKRCRQRPTLPDGEDNMNILKPQDGYLKLIFFLC